MNDPDLFNMQAYVQEKSWRSDILLIMRFGLNSKLIVISQDSCNQIDLHRTLRLILVSERKGIFYTSAGIIVQKRGALYTAVHDTDTQTNDISTMTST